MCRYRTSFRILEKAGWPTFLLLFLEGSYFPINLLFLSKELWTMHCHLKLTHWRNPVILEFVYFEALAYPIWFRGLSSHSSYYKMSYYIVTIFRSAGSCLVARGAAHARGLGRGGVWPYQGHLAVGLHPAEAHGVVLVHVVDRPDALVPVEALNRAGTLPEVLQAAGGSYRGIKKPVKKSIIVYMFSLGIS